jgi:DNA-binding NarL/FixJ family response regulator
MSLWGVQLVVGKLLTDDGFRQRYETGPRDALSKLCEQGIDLTEAEVTAFVETDSRVWTTMASSIDARLRAPRAPRFTRSATHANRRLTPREREVLRGIFEGLSNKQIATELGVSESAVKATLQNLFRKTHVRTRAQLVRIVVEGQPLTVAP